MNFVNKKVTTYALLLAMVASVFCFPIVGYGAAVEVGTATKVKAKAVSSSKIKLTWKKVEAADGYKIYRYNPKRKIYVGVEFVKDGSAEKYLDTGRRAFSRYYYKVQAYKRVDGKIVYGSKSETAKVKTKHNKASKAVLSLKQGKKVLAKAKTRVGCAYRSGASGPRAFDCSGLVYWAYKNAGVSLKKKVVRTSSAGLYSSLKKYRVGSSIKSAKPGDILLFNRGGRISHAAIYAGKGTIVHAATPRKGVCKASFRGLQNSGTRLTAVVRVVK